jgi:hypothetical protein
VKGAACHLRTPHPSGTRRQNLFRVFWSKQEAVNAAIGPAALAGISVTYGIQHGLRQQARAHRMVRPSYAPWPELHCSGLGRGEFWTGRQGIQPLSNPPFCLHALPVLFHLDHLNSFQSYPCSHITQTPGDFSDMHMRFHHSHRLLSGPPEPLGESLASLLWLIQSSWKNHSDHLSHTLLLTLFMLDFLEVLNISLKYMKSPTFDHV